MPPPPLTRVHLTAVHPPSVAHLVDRLRDIITAEGVVNKIIDENDTFILSRSGPNCFSMSSPEPCQQDDTKYLNEIPKHIVSYDSGLPSEETTPFFNHADFYENLLTYRSKSRITPSQFGNFIFYGETVTSTNTMMDKNPKLLQRLPNGLTFVATTQIAGRGRGSNIWISPKGCMSFSTVIHHPQSLNTTAPVVLIQFLAGLAVVEGIKTYAQGYESMAVRLKWPNDIYAPDPSSPSESFVKIGGILVTSSFQAGEFNLVVGVGINIDNAAPTTSLNLLRATLNPALPKFTQEKLLASILVKFEELYLLFCRDGWQQFEMCYYRHWLHSGQVVTLEMEGGAKGRVVGITSDCGLLKVEELLEGRPTGRIWTLMSNGNRFDFFKGLLKQSA